jgi:protoheme IX farnesyltransferase
LYTDKCRLEYKKEPEFKISYYKDLSKAKLASFVLISTMAGYALAPGMGSVAGLLNVTVGTGLCIASANTFNQWIEIPYDSQMSRTRNRILPRHAISPTHAFIAGTLSGVLGTSILSAVNPYCALLGFSNIILYSFVYTPMKRTSIYNTWVGSIVGAVPPVIGWVACTSTFDIGSMILAGKLFQNSYCLCSNLIIKVYYIHGNSLTLMPYRGIYVPITQKQDIK